MLKSQRTVSGTTICFMLLPFDCDAGYEPPMPMQMMESGAPGYPMDMMDMGPPPHTGFGSMGPGEMMHPASGPPAQPHPRMMQPQQQQQQPVGHRMAGHMMNSGEVLGGQSAPHDQMSPWFDGNM